MWSAADTVVRSEALTTSTRATARPLPIPDIVLRKQGAHGFVGGGEGPNGARGSSGGQGS